MDFSCVRQVEYIFHKLIYIICIPWALKSLSHIIKNHVLFTISLSLHCCYQLICWCACAHIELLMRSFQKWSTFVPIFHFVSQIWLETKFVPTKLFQNPHILKFLSLVGIFQKKIARRTTGAKCCYILPVNNTLCKSPI